MYNNYNLEKLLRTRGEIDHLINSYQQPQQPMAVFNMNSQAIDFEARMIENNEDPEQMFVQRKTAFIDLHKGKLTIKETNGDIKAYEIVLPKDEKDLKIEELERRLKEYELSTTSKFSKPNEEDEKLSSVNDSRTKKNDD